MSNRIIKVRDAEIAVSTANTVYNSNLVRVYAPANTVITVAGTVNGSFTMPGGTVEFIEKGATDTIASSVGSVQAVPVSYKA